jgi:hypothetical protein
LHSPAYWMSMRSELGLTEHDPNAGAIGLRPPWQEQADVDSPVLPELKVQGTPTSLKRTMGCKDGRTDRKANNTDQKDSKLGGWNTKLHGPMKGLRVHHMNKNKTNTKAKQKPPEGHRPDKAKRLPGHHGKALTC